jgi:hypothetical protein
VSPLPFADPLSIGEAPHHFESHPTGSDHLQTRRSSATVFEIGGGGWTAKPQRRALRVRSDIPSHDEPGVLGGVRSGPIGTRIPRVPRVHLESWGRRDRPAGLREPGSSDRIASGGLAPFSAMWTRSWRVPIAVPSTIRRPSSRRIRCPAARAKCRSLVEVNAEPVMDDYPLLVGLLRNRPTVGEMKE